MKILLDTHILIWTLNLDEKLSQKARGFIFNSNAIYYSTVSIWEIEMKNTAHPKDININGKKMKMFCDKTNFINLPFKDEHALILSFLQRQEGAPQHKDPFDRMLICQAISEDMLFLTHDKLLQYYECPNVFLV